MRKYVRNFLILSIGAVLFVACSGYERVLKSNDVNYKLKKANEYYDKKKFVQANSIYESLLPVLKNTRNYEPLMYRYAYTFYQLEDYISASYYFKNFTDIFPNSNDVEECEYMYALCLYKESPKYSLDQNYTQKAMGALQTYVNAYPNSKRADSVNMIIDICRKKLEVKKAKAALLYYDIGHYKAASVYYSDLILEYPESPKVDEYKFMIMKSWYEYAKQSIKSKQEERYANVLSNYRELQEEYPDSKYISEAKKYYTLADENIKAIRNEQ